MAAVRVSSLAGATIEAGGAAAVLPAGLEGGGVLVLVNYDEPPDYTLNEQAFFQLLVQRV